MSISDRQLKAIMFTDIVGYTSMMQTDENLALFAVKRHEELLNIYVPKYGGVVQQLMGDGSLCLFNSAVASVECARDIQLALISDEYVPIRIGIHVGDVRMEGNKTYGDGVNLASRIESSGHAGIILFSKSVRSKLINKRDLQSKSVGVFSLKNVAKPMELFALSDPRLSDVNHSLLKNRSGKSKNITNIFAVFGLLALIFFVSSLIKPDLLKHTLTFLNIEKGVNTIAVFPFKTSDHEEISYLESGMMDLLYTKVISLEGLNGLDPIICSSLYEKSGRDIQSILAMPAMSDHDVDYFISGQVLKIGNQIKLVGNVFYKNGKPLEPIEMNFIIGDELLENLNKFFHSILARIFDHSNHDFTSVALTTTTNFEALKDYMEGENARRKGSFLSAHVHYKEALEKDSTFALAWMRLYNNSGFYQGERDQKYQQRNAKVMLNKYIDVLPGPLQKYVSAVNYLTEGKIPKGINILENLLDLHGDNPDVLYLIGDVMFHTNMLYNKDIENGIQYFDKVLNYTELYSEAEFHKFMIAMRNNDFEGMTYFLEKYPEVDINKTFYFEYMDGIYDTEPTDTILDHIENYEYFPFFDFLFIDKFDKCIELVEKYPAELKEAFSGQFDWIDFEKLRVQGRFNTAFQKYPENNIAGSNYFMVAYRLSETNFQPFSASLADSVLNFLEEFERFNPKQSFHFTARAIYRLISGDLEKVKIDIDTLQQRYNKADQPRPKSMLYYNLYRLKASYARKVGNNNLALLYLDTLNNELMHWIDYGRLYGSFYSGLKFMEAEILLEEGRTDEAFQTFSNMDKSLGYTPNIFYAPIKFRLGFIHELMGETKKAYKYYKYFVSIYGDCDEFYRDNVRYAQDKITEYEKKMN